MLFFRLKNINPLSVVYLPQIETISHIHCIVSCITKKDQIYQKYAISFIKKWNKYIQLNFILIYFIFIYF
jgi:hypothetical protein